MNKEYSIICVFLAVLLNINDVFAAGLDEIYRDLVRSDNRGYLPLFVKNRTTPLFIDEDKLVEPIENVEGVVDDEEALGVNFENKRLIKNAEVEAENQRWQMVLDNVQAGYVSSFELDELEKRERENNPQAIEVLAWIYSQGIGVEPDLVKAFVFYKKAIEFDVPEAKENAIKVYKAMTSEQKAKLSE